MMLVTIEVVDGAYTASQQQDLIHLVTEAAVKIEGESLRPKTWVRLKQIPSGRWAIGGRPITPDTLNRMAAEQPDSSSNSE